VADRLNFSREAGGTVRTGVGYVLSGHVSELAEEHSMKVGKIASGTHPSTNEDSPRSGKLTLPWNEDLREIVLAAVAERGMSTHAAAREIGWDLSSLRQWLSGRSVVYPKTAHRVARWLGASPEKAAAWKAEATAYKGSLRWGGSRSVVATCVVCGTKRKVRLAQMRRRRVIVWTCSATCRSQARLKPGPTASPGNYAVFEAVRRAGSSTALQQKTGLSRRIVHRLCADPEYAPTSQTLGKLSVIEGFPFSELFPKRARDKWNETLERVRKLYPKGSKPAKAVFGQRAGQARRGHRFPRLSESLRQAALRKKEADPRYGRAVAERLARGQRSPHWKAIRFIMNHLRTPHRRVFRSPKSVVPDEVPDSQLREWAAADEDRTGIPRGYLLQVWKSWLGLGGSKRGGRPTLIKRLELVETLRSQGCTWDEIARQVSEAEYREIDPASLRVWYSRTPLRRVL
jgi:lambda repressor-like predicted transcriptional regulator